MSDSLDYFDLVRAARKLDATFSQSVRVALLADSSTQHLVPLLRVLFHRQGINCEVYEAPFDAIELEVYNEHSGLYRFAPDVVVILNSVQALRTSFGKRQIDGVEFVEDTADRIAQIWSCLRTHTNATILQSNFALPYERYFGNFDLKVLQSLYSVVCSLNVQIAARARENGAVLINDVESLSSWLGRRVWFDDRFWDMAKSFCALEQLPYVARNIVQVASALRGRAVKCVIVDLDNTLWGGVIGDDGLEGIKLNAHGDGEAFYRLQSFLKELVKRGILLAVCSKNDPSNAVLPFEQHPEMLLKLSDFACFVANWQDKAENIRQIRETLNIGYDSMVFLDDNSFERNLVRGLLPDVIVPELPEDPAGYVRAICELNLFETTSFSSEDRHRTQLYRQEEARRQEEAAFASFEEYLQSLKMQMVVSRFDPYHIPRIAQLMQRSNQFNLTTRRRTEAECIVLMANSAYIPLYATLRDRLGDHGLISVVIAEILKDEVVITDWLMSCRVLKRGVEQTLMNGIIEHARHLGLWRVIGEYRPTGKNEMVKDFFAQFGFRPVDNDSGCTMWQIYTDLYTPQTTFIEPIASVMEPGQKLSSSLWTAKNWTRSISR